MEGRSKKGSMLLWLAAPAAFFLLVNIAGALGMSRLHRRIVLSLYGGQPGAAVVLVSALAALVIAIGRVAEMRGENGRFSQRVQGNHTAHVLVFGLLIAWVFARFYIREYAWLYTTGGSGFFEAAVVVVIVTAALRLRRMPGRRHTAG